MVGLCVFSRARDFQKDSSGWVVFRPFWFLLSFSILDSTHAHDHLPCTFCFFLIPPCCFRHAFVWNPPLLSRLRTSVSISLNFITSETMRVERKIFTLKAFLLPSSSFLFVDEIPDEFRRLVCVGEVNLNRDVWNGRGRGDFGWIRFTYDFSILQMNASKHTHYKQTHTYTEIHTYINI